MAIRAGQVYDPDLGGYRPQRFSIASTGSSVSWNPFDFESTSVRSSTSSYPSIASCPSYFSTPSYYSTAPTIPTSISGPQRSSYTNPYATQPKTRSTTPISGTIQRLPSAVYDTILVHLRAFHEDAASLSCQTCFLRDMSSLALVSRKWDRAVRPRL